jgi:exopolysaccharide biosynthesis polyprenyl glycosylphosphotransferase
MLEVEQRVDLASAFDVHVRLPLRVPMVRRFQPYGFVVQDVVLICTAFVLALGARYRFDIGPRVAPEVPVANYPQLGVLVLGIMMFTLVMKGAYRRRLSTEVVDEIKTIFGAATIAIASVIVITYMLHRFEYSRGVIVYLWLFLIALLSSGRTATRFVQSLAYRRGWRVRRLLVVGSSDAGKMIMQSVRNRPDLGYEVVGFVDRRDSERAPQFGRFERLGSIDDLPGLIASERIDDIIVALPGSAHEQLNPVVRLCEQTGIGLKLIPDLFDVSLSRVQVDNIAGIPLLDVREKPIRRLERATKRAVDLVIGTSVLLLSLPVMAVVAVLIHLDTGGPIFIRQERVGKDGRPFNCYKLRSMHVDADSLLATLLERNEASGPLFKMRNDPRCTRVGRHLRRLSLDELPQIWNVVKGEMSLVGPRPPLVAEVAKYEEWQMRRLEVKPGMTGIWQVSGRSTLTFDEMVMMDVMYVDSWSPALDLKILLRTGLAVIAGRGAY